MQQAIIQRGFLELRSRFPAGWTVSLKSPSSQRGRKADGVISVTAPSGERTSILVEAKAKVSATVAASVVKQVKSLRGDSQGAIVFAEFISDLARQRFREQGIGYQDLTGNVWLVLDKPAVFISTTGAERDPKPVGRGVRSLKGPKAARLVRALCDWFPPVGVRELARRAGTDAGYATRVLALLQQDEIVARDSGGSVIGVRWTDLLRRWAQDYSVYKTNEAMQFIAPRGLPALEKRLRSYNKRYAVTSSAAVPPTAEIAPSRVFTCYVDDTDVAASKLGLKPADVGANVFLLLPFDTVVYERGRDVGGLKMTALSQCVVDLLTGSGREPAQGEAVVEWMGKNERQWRL
jgi:hypothetical protein